MHKILLVEDDEIIRQQVKQLLEQWGYEVVAVEDFMDVLEEGFYNFEFIKELM